MILRSIEQRQIWVGLISWDCPFKYCCTVPRRHRTATVRPRPCTLYTEDRHRR